MVFIVTSRNFLVQKVSKRGCQRIRPSRDDPVLFYYDKRGSDANAQAVFLERFYLLQVFTHSM